MKIVSPLAWIRIARRPWQASPPLLLAMSFMVLIFLGGLLFKLPFATTRPITWFEAFFTATSAVCVTGFDIIGFSDTLTLFGQFVLMALIQLGGIGVMTFAALTLLLLSGRLGMGYQQLMGDAMNQTQPRDLFWLFRRIGGFVLIAEAIGVVLIAIRWVPEFGWLEGLGRSLFHTVAAFNNAGISLWPDGLARFRSDAGILLVTSLLVIAGGLGYTVVTECWQYRDHRRLSLHSKLTLSGTLLLLVLGFVLFSAIEWNNAASLGGQGWGARLLDGWFMSVTSRTAGFATFEPTGLQGASIVLLILFMFIGAGTNSTGGGIKVSTMMVLLLTTKSFLTGRTTPVVFGRSFGITVVYRALAMSFIALLTIISGIFLLALTDPGCSLEALTFEVVSAFTTTGLSMGITPGLSMPGQLLLMLLMFMGRVGPLTLALLLTRREPSRVTFAEGEVYIG